MSSYLFKIGSKLKVIPAKMLDDFTENEALAIGLSCIDEQRKQLVKDALDGDKYYYGRKVVDALETSINKLEEKYPHIKQQIKQITFSSLDLN